MMHGSLPAKLQVLRARQGLTLIDAAEKLGIGRDTLSDLERGIRHPVMPTLTKIAQGYGVAVEDLLEEPVPLVEAPPPSGPSHVSKDRLGPQAGKADGVMDPATAAAALGELRHMAEGLAAVWNQDVELYERHGRDLQPYRTLEMSTAVVVLYQQFWGVLEALQHRAQQLGLDPDVRTWESQSKQLLLESGSSIRALAELYEVIDRSAADPDADSDNFRAMREEFDADTPAFLVEDPQWPEALEKARVAVGLA